jgi:hypothetical protein
MVYEPGAFGLGGLNDGGFESATMPITPNQYFHALFPVQTMQFGPAFLELRETNLAGKCKMSPISINVDFFASILSDSGLGLRVVYFEPEMQFYYSQPFQLVYKPVTPEKLQNLYRGLLIRAATSITSDVNIFNLFHEFRSDKRARQVTNRAKSILACDSSYFSATSPHQRVKGQELHERVMLRLVETMLEPREGEILTVTQAYEMFCRLSERQSLERLKRSVFKEAMRDLIKEKYGMALRHDVPDSLNRHQQAWKGLRLVEAGVEPA